MKIVVVRHGETDRNVANLCQGWTDIDLNKNGIEQAKKVGERLKNQGIEAIYSSDLKRAYNTAKEISKTCNLPIIKDKRLREQCKGVYENNKSGTDMWADFIKSGKGLYDWTPQDGESYGKLLDRVLEFLKEVELKHENQKILIVTHGGPASTISRIAHKDYEIKPSGEGFDHTHKNTAVSEYSTNDQDWKIIKHKCIEHLK